MGLHWPGLGFRDKPKNVISIQMSGGRAGKELAVGSHKGCSASLCGLRYEVENNLVFAVKRTKMLTFLANTREEGSTKVSGKVPGDY